jgi:hypothetical protein
MGKETTAQTNPQIPQIAPPDYTKTLSPEVPSIPEDWQEKYSSPELIQKVKRKIIKGRIDGN